MNIYVSTLFRQHCKRGHKGRLYKVDYKTGQHEMREFDVSFRGLVRHNGKLLVADYTNNIYEVDEDSLEITKAIELKDCGYLHLLYSRDGVLWTTNSGNNTIVKVHEDGEEETIKLHPSSSDVLHFNSLDWAPSGEEFHIYNKQSGVFNYTKKQWVIRGLNAPHDIMFIAPNLFMINNSAALECLLVEADTGRIVEKMLELRESDKSTKDNTWGFTRGMARVDKDTVVSGSTPCTLHYYDTEAFCKFAEVVLSTDPDESIFDILVDSEE